MRSKQMTEKDIVSYVFGEAAKSNVEKRKVGCVIVDATGKIMGTGHNKESNTAPDLHAEMMALNQVTPSVCVKPCTVYVSHEPCPDCAKNLADRLGTDTKIEVVKQFMKFDGDKLRYDLVPPSAIKALAEVLTFGARKYKPNNWKQCEEQDRYVAALYRHLEAWRSGEVNDTDSGMPHLAHAMTNIAFLLELGYNPGEWK